MAPAIAASFVPGGQWIAPAVAAGQFGASSAQDTEDKLRNQGISDADATAAGWRTGLIQGPMEGIATAVGARAFAAAKPLLGIGSQTTAGIAARATDTAVIKPLAKGLGLNLLVQPATEVAQDLGTEFNERSFGATPQDAWEIAKDSAQGGIGLTLLLGPFAAGGHVSRAGRAQAMKDALYSPNTPEMVRAQARDLILAEAQKQDVSPQDMESWLDQQFMGDDARFADEAARSADAGPTLVTEPAPLQGRIDSALAIGAPSERKGYEKRFEAAASAPGGVRISDPQTGVERELSALEVAQRGVDGLDSPLGAQQPSPTANTQGSTAVTQLAETQRAAIEQRTRAAAAAAVPPTPAQQEEEAAAAEQVRLAQEAVVFIQQNGIAAKNALPVVKEMLASGQVLTPALRGAMRGALVTGDVNGARKMLVEAKKAKAKADAAVAKEIEAVNKDQAEQDRVAAEVIAAREKNQAQQGAKVDAPTPANPGAQTSPTTSPQGATTSAAPTVAEKTPGQKLIEGIEARSGKKVHPQAKRRLYLLAGLDPDEGFMVGSPKTLEQVAAIEAAMLGASKAVSREAIRKSLAVYGINSDVMNRLGAMVATQEDASATETNADGELVDVVAPEDNTPVTQDEAFGAAMEGSQDSGGGMSVRSNLGSGIVEPEKTSAVARVEKQADTLLAQAAGSSTKRGADAQERLKSAVDEATTQVVSPEQIAKNAQLIAENAKLIEEMNREVQTRSKLRNLLPEAMHAEIERAAEDFAETMAEGDTAWGDLEPQRQAQWVKAFVSWDTGNIDTRTFNKIFEGIQDDTRREAGQVRGQPTQPGPKPVGPRDGNVRQDAPRNDVRGAGEATGAAESAARGAQEAVDGAGAEQVALGPDERSGLDATTQRERDLRALSHEVEQPGDVMLGNDKFVTLEQAKAAAQAAIDAGVLRADAPFQYNNILDIAPRDWGRMVKEMTGQPPLEVGNARFSRTMQPMGSLRDKVGKQVQVMPQSVADMERTPAIKKVFDKYRADGIGHILGAVKDWFVTANRTDWGGAYTEINGRPAVVMTMRTMLFPDQAEWTMHHEMGHAVDLSIPGGAYSGMPEFNLRIVGDSIRAHGLIAEQVLDHYEQNPDSPFAGTMRYPLDRKTHGDLDAQAIREEMFAQLWATYNTRAGKEYLEDNLPDVADFMETVYADIAQNQYGEESSPGGPDGGSPQGRASRSQAPRYARAEPGPRGNDQPVRFSRGSALQAQLTPAARAASGATSQFIKDVKSQGILWGAFTEDLINSVAAKLPSAKTYLDLVKRSQVAKTRAEREIESILDMYNALPKAERGTGPGSVNAFLKDSTMAKAWGYQPTYLHTVQIDPAMEARYKAMSPQARQLVTAVFKHGHDNLVALKSAVIGNINTEFDALIAGYEAEGDKRAADAERKAKQKALRDFESLNALDGSWPYAPLKRFGNHVVVGKSQAYLDAEEAGDTRRLETLRADENHYFVSFTDTKYEARALREKISGRYADATNFEKDGVEYGSRDMLGAFRRLRTLVDDSQDDKLSTNAKKAMNRLMVDLHLTLLGEQSARQAERNRTGVAGADADMMRAFATQGRASAHFIASLTNNGQIAEQLRTMRQEADGFRGAEREGTRAAYNEVLRRHAMGIDYQPTPLVDKALSASSVWMLLTSPAYFLTNATQPFVMSLPTLAGKHGYTRSFSAMTKAYNDIFPLVKDGTITQDDYSRMPADVKAIIEDLVNRGRIDISLEQDLGRWRSTEDSKLAVFGKAVDKMRGVTQTVESVNRIVTAIAAARLELGRNANPSQAADYAESVIFNTHGDYSGFNAPRVMRTGIGRLLTQFRKFQLIQISLYAKLLNGAFKGATAEERLVARKALAFNLTHMFLLGGALGMPGAQVIGWVLRQVFGDDDEPDNPEVTLRRMLPPELGDLLVKGAPAALGIDLSGRLGAGNMLSLLPYADTSISRKGYEAAVMGALGPFVGGLLPKFADGIDLIGQGDYWKGSEQLLPKGFADLSKAIRQETSGMTQRNGDLVMSPEDISFLAGVSQAIGLPSTTITDRSMRASAKFKADEFFNNRTAQIKREYVEAYRSGDNSALSEARQEWLRLQEARQGYGYKVQPLSELLKAPSARAKREANTAGGVQFRKENEAFVRAL